MDNLAIYQKLVLGFTANTRTDAIISNKPLSVSFKIPKSKHLISRVSQPIRANNKSNGMENNVTSDVALEKKTDDLTVEKTVSSNNKRSPEWVKRVVDSLDNFDYNSPEIKELFKEIFDHFGLTPIEFISKSMSNPDFVMGLLNPKVHGFLNEFCKDPTRPTGYENDKEVMDAVDKFSEHFSKLSKNARHK